MYSTKYIGKRTLVYSVRAEQRRQSVTFFDLCWECEPQATQFFHRSAHVLK